MNIQDDFSEKMLQDIVKQYKGQLFTLSSGYKSPVYCDNRVITSLPEFRSFLKNYLTDLIKQNFKSIDAIVPVATGAIAMGTLVADQLNLPSVPVHPKHQIIGSRVEGYLKKGSNIVIYEDLISKGDSVAEVIVYLRKKGHHVLGVVTSFEYGFDTTKKRYTVWGVPVYAFTNLENLCLVAEKTKIWDPGFIELVKHFRRDPTRWHEYLKK